MTQLSYNPSAETAAEAASPLHRASSPPSRLLMRIPAYAGGDRGPIQRNCARGSGGTCGAPDQIQLNVDVRSVDDPLEAEADDVARHLVGASPSEADGTSNQTSDDAGGVRGALSDSDAAARGEAPAAEEARAGEEPIQVKQSSAAPGEAQLQAASGTGGPLSSTARHFFEPRLATDLGHVRVHADDQADEYNRSLGARAFTTGSDIFFRAGEYRPDSQAGRSLLAHELAHVMQQGGDGRLTSLAGRAEALTPRWASSVFVAARRHAAPRIVQRSPIFEAALGPAPGSMPVPSADKLDQLNIDAGGELRRLAGNAIHAAATQFQLACMDVKADLQKRAKQVNDMLSLVLDICAGFAAPAFAGKIIGDALLRRNLAAAVKAANSHDVDKAWGGMLDEANILEEMMKKGVAVNPSFLDKISGDNLKATFTGAARGASNAIKNAGPTTLTSDKEKIVDQLGQLAQLGAQDLDRSLAFLEVQDWTSILISLDASVANKANYAVAISRFLNEVLTIGETQGNQFGGGTNRLVKVNAFGGPRLAVVKSGQEGIIFGTPFTDFVSWVSPGMEQGALERAGMTLDQVPNLDPGQVGNTPFGKGLTPPGPDDSRILPPPSTTPGA